ncbi:MAG: hypothetical protein K2Q21_10335 [Chitinophagaceae bacterium]|nr:hypothetical protein [Chitinophagaceae bacterium]
MKNTLLLLFVLSIYCVGCQKEKAETTKSVEVAVIIDASDKLVLAPNVEHILPLFEFDNCIDNEAFFSLTSITDKRIVSVAELHLASGAVSEKKNVEDDAQYRNTLVVNFCQNVRSVLTDFIATHRNDSTKSSQCFSTIATTLQFCLETKSAKKILIIHSDLREHSSIFSCYSFAGRNELEQHPESVLKIFDQTKLLPQNLKNITVIFSFLPRNSIDDTQYYQMSSIYKKMIEARGGRVVIKSNTNYESL